MIGPPTLPATTVDKIFAQMSSPMVGTGQVVEQASRQANIDDAFALGVWWTETNDGAAGVGSADRNPGSVRGSSGYPSAYDGYTIYPSYAAAILDWFSILRSRYVSRGLISAYTICYPYVGTSSASLWAGKVVNLMYRYRGEAPTVTPTPTTTPKPTLSPTATARDLRNRRLAHMLQVADAAQSDTTSPAGQNIRHAALQEENIPPFNVASLSNSSGIATLPIVLLGLVAALAIALGSLFIGRTAPINALENLNPVNGNVVGARFIVPTSVMGNAVGARFIAPEARPVTEALAPNFRIEEHVVPQLDFPTQPLLVSIPNGQERYGQPRILFEHKHTSEIRKRQVDMHGRLRLIPSRLEASNTENQDLQEPKTESLLERELVTVGVRREGLLRQYAKEQ